MAHPGPAAAAALLLRPELHGVLSVLKAARNGAVYGAKIRFPHALVMSVLFGRGSAQDRARFVYRATRQHATNLLKFAALYKAVTIFLRTLRGQGHAAPSLTSPGVPDQLGALLAGALGGYVVFGERNAVNEQIVLYCTARIVSSFLPRAKVGADWPATKPVPTDNKVFRAFATITWALIMWDFVARRQSLQNGLVVSMDCKCCSAPLSLSSDCCGVVASFQRGTQDAGPQMPHTRPVCVSLSQSARILLFAHGPLLLKGN